MTRQVIDPAVPREKVERLKALKEEVERKTREHLRRTYRSRWLCDLPECDGNPHDGFHWCEHPIDAPKGAHVSDCRHARTSQRPPAAWERTWYVRGGRGSGKTRTASEALADLIKRAEQPSEFAVCAPTFADARDTCMESMKSGLLKALGATIGEGGQVIERGDWVGKWNRSNGQLWTTNGCLVYTDGADDGAYRIQGKDLSAIWCDELGLWKRWKAAWDESIRYATRQDGAKIIATGTPKRALPARVLIKRLINDPDVANVRLLTFDNADNLSDVFLTEMSRNRGTVLERQELEGELLEEVEGALWGFEVIEANRADRPGPTRGDPFSVTAIYERVQPTRVVIAVDPAASFGEDSDEHGVVVVARGADHHLYVLDDLSRRSPVTEWPRVVAEAYDRWQADRVVGEVNNGGDYIEATLRAEGFRGSYETVRASRGKQLRADPVAQFYTQGCVHHVGVFEALEEQMVSWVPEEAERSHDDRIDALVYACAYLEPKLMGRWADLYANTTPATEEVATVDDDARRQGGEEPPAPSEPSPPVRRGWGSMYDSEPRRGGNGGVPSAPMPASTPAEVQERRERERRLAATGAE